jgi:hypothetical protein
MNQSESQIKGSNIKELSQLKEDIQIKKKNQYDKNHENQCLPSGLLMDINEHDDYYKYYFKDTSNSLDEESNEERISDNKINSKGNISFENSTQDNSNNLLNFSQNNKFLFNNNSNINNHAFFNNNQIPFSENNNNSFLNPNNSLNNFNLNYFNNNSNNNFEFPLFYNNNGNSNKINFTNNSFNSNLPKNMNSFIGLSPMNSLNFNNYMLPLSFNSEMNNSKCVSFKEMKSNPKKCFSGVKFNKKNLSNIENNINEDSMNNNNFSNSSIKKLFEMSDQNLYNYIITQKGSRDVQNIIKKVNENEVEILISKIKNYFSEITLDKYGNYFSRKLIQICIPSQRIKLLESMKNRFVEIANSSYGTHPLQNLIEIINMAEEKKIVLNYILNNESILALDSKGTHVLQKFISCTKDEERSELNQNLINLIDRLIINPFGVCVLIKLVKHTKDKSIPKKIANYITNGDPLSFIQHPYANYAVQILLSNTDLSDCDIIIETIIQNYLSLSMQKFSSNVVENCIKYGEEKTVKKIYNSIIEEDKLESLLNNTYGNFVLEKLIERLKIEEKLVIIKKIENFGKNKNISKNILNLLNK